MIISIAIAFMAAWGAAWLGTALVRAVLLRRHVLDRPNERSSHVVPVPRGAGLAVTPVVAIGWVFAAALYGAPEAGDAAASTPGATAEAGVLAALALALGAISFIDDLRGLPAAVRLAGQAAAIAAMLWMFPISVAWGEGLLAPWAQSVLLGLVWLWFVNLFNFMDGIDGLAGVETISIGAGVALAGFAAVGLTLGFYWGAIAAGAALGFLMWNWAPARVFLGDVGSVPLGFLQGWLLLDLASRGLWAAAIIIPLYYVLDATLTLIRRAARGERIWQAHREHFYQQAVRRGASHAAVSQSVLAANAVLVGLAVMSAAGWIGAGHALIAAFACAGALLLVLARWRSRVTLGGARAP